MVRNSNRSFGTFNSEVHGFTVHYGLELSGGIFIGRTDGPSLIGNI